MTVDDNGMADLSHTFIDAPFDDANETLHMVTKQNFNSYWYMQIANTCVLSHTL